MQMCVCLFIELQPIVVNHELSTRKLIFVVCEQFYGTTIFYYAYKSGNTRSTTDSSGESEMCRVLHIFNVILFYNLKSMLIVKTDATKIEL